MLSISDKWDVLKKRAENLTTRTAVLFAVSEVIFSKLADMKGVGVVFVVLLRSNLPLKLLDLYAKLPIIGKSGRVGKLLFSRILNHLNRKLVAFGEPAIMGKLVRVWREKGIDAAAVAEDIRGLPSLVINSEVKEEAIALVKEYYARNRPA